MSNEKEDLNVTEMLIDIRERLVRVETNTRHLDSTATKVEKAYSIAKENQKDIGDLNERSKWTQRTAITAILIPIGLFLFEKLIGG
ncbi:hemolysin XhlA family protein [Latilactobacillus curvatus]|uniref:hemolysin XhlA family protein n=1 Tax=Latilactobacillus curvatus TaxID=28038 RepID=UPI0020C8121E|nr:hemolysin XhlA family protein [Latilactobacillus curvatus]MCP8847906.1 hemolysin XhlA family protein [Latilactobacillus curvatus]MCP8864633.1 hemolysin XhlA family protein [Latilactobacillus curvatus]MCP8873458.1 hemolysin XhlA family protein [Latilactobacillus curvatus]MCP8875251.1 hemolysin XhlA family protein [Latilactobacillus curvatus]MCP8878893.1 hemolysin XhlA family protein [Latilactobacillus curvatus]